MLLHADSLDDFAVMEADACVVGAGPVGILLALRLVAAGRTVLLVESGEDWDDIRCQDLNIGSTGGLWAGNLRDIRVRRLGGTMHVWGGNSRPLDPEDLVPRPWIRRSGWPISHQEIEPYFRAAHDALDLGEYRYVPDAPALWPDNEFEEILFRLSPDLPGPTSEYRGEFSSIHRQALERQPGLTVLLGATVLRLERTPDGRAVAAAESMTFRGKAQQLRARAFILACGGIETPRLLLASGLCGRSGAGAVGSCFMEHPHGLAGFLLASNDPRLEKFSPGAVDAGVTTQHRWRLRPEVQFEERLLNVSFQLIQTDIIPGEFFQYEQDFKVMEKDVRNPEFWKRYYVTFLSEQAPVTESNVTLGEELDFFGVRKAHLNWRLSEIDRKTVQRATALLNDGMFCGSGFRFVNRLPGHLSEWPVGWGAHHMGTTRMGDDPTQSVVDRNAKMHDLANLYVAGSPIFATAGMANPMLTALALALRLADHLAGELDVLHMTPMPERQAVVP
jgi:choline dehydrogenase-like flavoprotein